MFSEDNKLSPEEIIARANERINELDDLIKSWDDMDDKNIYKVESTDNADIEVNLDDDEFNEYLTVLEAVRSDGLLLKFASENLKADKEVVLEAVKSDGRAFEYASENLKADKEVVLEAVKFDGRAFEYASDTLRNDPQVLIQA